MPARTGRNLTSVSRLLEPRACGIVRALAKKKRKLPASCPRRPRNAPPLPPARSHADHGAAGAGARSGIRLRPDGRCQPWTPGSAADFRAASCRRSSARGRRAASSLLSATAGRRHRARRARRAGRCARHVRRRVGGGRRRRARSPALDPRARRGEPGHVPRHEPARARAGDSGAHARPAGGQFRSGGVRCRAKRRPSALRRLPFTTWLRLQRMLEGRQTVCVLVGPEPMARSSAGLTLQLRAMAEGSDSSAPRRSSGLEIMRACSGARFREDTAALRSQGTRIILAPRVDPLPVTRAVRPLDVRVVCL